MNESLDQALKFHKNGNLKQEETYHYGKLKNISSYFLPDGIEIGNKTFIDGEGIIYDYYEDGVIFSSTKYEQGLIDGLFQEFYKNGKLASKGMYNENNKIGTWYEYSKRGLIRKTTDYDE